MKIKIPSFALAQKILFDFVSKPDSMVSRTKGDNQMIQHFDDLKIGSSVGFDELPDSLEFGTNGVVEAVHDHDDSRWFILTIASNGATICFHDGCSWSECRQYKLHDQFRWERD